MIGVAIETYGCTMNQSDSDIMRYELFKLGFEIVPVEEAEVVILNSCGVIDYTEKKIIKRAVELRKSGKKVVIAGCLPRISSRKVRAIADSAISPDNLLKIGEAVKAALDGRKYFEISKNYVEKSNLCKCRLRIDSSGNISGIAVVSIAEGCTGRCSFCATRFARGSLRSFSIDSIVREVEKAVKQGFVEIQLTSQDTGAYGLDKYGKYALPELLEKITTIDGNFKVRVGMMNPRHAYEMLDDLINAYASDKIYKFMHVPVQSGDEKILEAMNRSHGVEEYFEVVSAFRKEFDSDDSLISTDIIVGFPGEDIESFYKSLSLIKESKPDLVNITRYSPRKGTPAYKLKDMPDWIKKDRSRAITRLANKIKEKRNKRLVGKVLNVIITKRKDSGSLSRYISYRPVVVNCKCRIGETLKVKVVDCTPTHLRGEILESNVSGYRNCG